MDEKLITELEKDFLLSVAICKDRYGYNPTRFLQMLEINGPVNTAIALVTGPNIHEGLSKLWEFKRLDLSVEAIICKEKYRQLFSKEVLKGAKKKLTELGCSAQDG